MFEKLFFLAKIKMTTFICGGAKVIGPSMEKINFLLKGDAKGVGILDKRFQRGDGFQNARF